MITSTECTELREMTPYELEKVSGGLATAVHLGNFSMVVTAEAGGWACHVSNDGGYTYNSTYGH